MRAQEIFSLIASGSTLSSHFVMEGAAICALSFPVTNSSAVYLQGSFSTTSGDFRRIMNANLATPADFTIGVSSATGARALDVSAIVGAFPFFRVEFGTAVTSPATLTAIMKT